jgi:hypothetical protein
MQDWVKKIRLGLLEMYLEHKENVAGGDLPAQSMERIKRELSFDFTLEQITELLTQGKAQYLRAEINRGIAERREALVRGEVRPYKPTNKQILDAISAEAAK